MSSDPRGSSRPGSADIDPTPPADGIFAAVPSVDFAAAGRIDAVGAADRAPGRTAIEENAERDPGEIMTATIVAWKD